MIDTLERTDTTSIEDLDFESACEVRLAYFFGKKKMSEEPCERPAAWYGRYPCCGHLAILCDHHTRHDPTTFWCIPCEKEFGVEQLLALARLK